MQLACVTTTSTGIPHGLYVCALLLVCALVGQGLSLAIASARRSSPHGYPSVLLAVAALSAAASVVIGDGFIALRVGAPGLDTPYALGVGIWVDRVTAAMATLVCFVGLVVYRFSQTYLRSEVGRDAFLRKLALAVLLVQVFALSSGLLGHAVLWLFLSVSVHRLLRHYEERPLARLAAKKKFLISRVGDAFMVSALVLMFGQYGSLDIEELQHLRVATSGGERLADVLSGAFLVLAALAKSAQFPLHTWLPDAMDAPTPVSALMHAGIANAGAFLLLRAAALLDGNALALCLLIAVGGTSACFGVLIGSLQPSIKLKLAWSTIAQMGFLFFELGLGLTGAAALHLAGHAVYKAHRFLRSGTLCAKGRPLRPRLGSVLSVVLAAALAAGVGLWGLARWGGFDTAGHAPLAMVWALAMSQFLIGPPEVPLRIRAWTLLLFGGGLGALAWAAETAITPWFGVLSSPLHSSQSAWLIAWAVAGLAGVVAVLCAVGEWRSQWLERLSVYLLSGFYLSDFQDRLTMALWPDVVNRQPIRARLTRRFEGALR